LDLDSHEGVGIGPAKVFVPGQSTISTIDAAAVDASQTQRIELGPADDLLGLAGAANLSGHDAPRAGFQRPHHGGVISGGQAYEGIQAHSPSRPRGLLDLRDRDARMLLIQPDGVISALETDYLDNFRMTQLSQPENPHQLTLSQQLFEMRSH